MPTAPLTLVLYDGTGQPVTEAFDVLVGIRNGADIDKSFWHKGPVINMDIEFHDGPGDDYTVTVTAKGYRDTGDFVTADPHIHKTLKPLLIPNGATLTFCSWTRLVAKYPEASRFLGAGDNDLTGEQRYLDLQKTKPAALACFLNLVSAMLDIDLNGKTPLDFIKEVTFDGSFAQDRFFGYADPSIIPALQAAVAGGHFAPEEACAEFHTGSTCSYKQTDFDYSNVQLTFHEGDKKLIDGLTCVKIEPDMDLFKNLLNHGLMEVIPNLSTHGLTDPVAIFSLRWLDAADEQQSFDPGYSVT